MKKFILPNGLTYYFLSKSETYLWGGAGICDECGCSPAFGFLVPVLNHYQCPNCFVEWRSVCKRYPEDDKFEDEMIKYYENIVPLT